MIFFLNFNIFILFENFEKVSCKLLSPIGKFKNLNKFIVINY